MLASEKQSRLGNTQKPTRFRCANDQVSFILRPMIRARPRGSCARQINPCLKIAIGAMRLLVHRFLLDAGLCVVSIAIASAVSARGGEMAARGARITGTWKGSAGPALYPLEITQCDEFVAGNIDLKIAEVNPDGNFSGELVGQGDHGQELSTSVTGNMQGGHLRIHGVYRLTLPNGPVPTFHVKKNLSITLDGVVKENWLPTLAGPREEDRLDGFLSESMAGCGGQRFKRSVRLLRVLSAINHVHEGTTNSTAITGNGETEKGRSEPPQNVQLASGRYSVTSAAQWTGSGSAAVLNGTHGTIRVLSGTGTFAGISGNDKRVTVAPGESMNGTVELSVVNGGPSFAIAPLIYTPSWGNPASSWRLIAGWVRPGQNEFKAQIKVRAPQIPGTYHILFAYQLETNGASVASATNWARGAPVWGDGNDIAEFNQKQIREAQKFGCTINSYLLQKGTQLGFAPADAITVQVGPSVNPKPAVQQEGAALKIRMSVSSPRVAAGSQFTVWGVITKGNGFPVAGVAVQISAYVGGSTLPLTVVTTASNGLFTAALNAPPVTGSVVITATVQGIPPPVRGEATFSVEGNQ